MTRGAMRRGSWIAVGYVVLVGVACSSSDASGPSQSTTCSTGAPYEQLPAPAAQSADALSLHECVPRCGGEQKYSDPTYGTHYSIAALPSGPCDNDGERCSMAASTVAMCSGVTVPCDVSGFECACKSGNWQCNVTAQGGGICSPCARDAGTADAG